MLRNFLIKTWILCAFTLSATGCKKIVSDTVGTTATDTLTTTITDTETLTNTITDTDTLTLSPSSGPIGTPVQISGLDMSNTTAVTFLGVAAISLNSTSSSMTALVMPGSASGVGNATVGGVNYCSPSNFL